MSSTYDFSDTVETLSSRSRSEHGFLIAAATLARSGVQRYRASELGLKDHSPDSWISVYRSPQTLAAAVESFEGAPVVLNHQWVTSGNWRSVSVGDVRDVEIVGDRMVGTLVIRDRAAVREIEDGKRSQLSNGYRAQLTPQSGSDNGEGYDFIQNAVVGNHVALVAQSRCGAICSIADSAPEPGDRQQYVERINHEGRIVMDPFQADFITLQNRRALEGEGFDPDKVREQVEERRRAYVNRLQNAWRDGDSKKESCLCHELK